MCVADRRRVGEQRNPPLVEQPPHHVAALVLEELQRRVLRGDEHELDIVDADRLQVRPGHQGEFVQRQRPGRAGRNGEDNAADRAGAQIAQDVADPLAVRRPAERQRTRNGGCRHGADGNEKDVVADLTHGRQRFVPGRVDPEQPAQGERPTACGGSKRPDFVASRLPQSERLRNGQRPVPEVRLRPEELDLDAIPGQGVQGQHRFDRCHSTSGNQHAGLHRPPQLALRP